MSYHICVPVDVAMEKLRDGVNFFSSSPSEAFAELVKQQEAGKKYFTGCDNEDADGRCQGHPEEGHE
jgi:hypothetical protein